MDTFDSTFVHINLFDPNKDSIKKLVGDCIILNSLIKSELSKYDIYIDKHTAIELSLLQFEYALIECLNPSDSFKTSIMTIYNTLKEYYHLIQDNITLPLNEFFSTPSNEEKVLIFHSLIQREMNGIHVELKQQNKEIDAECKDLWNLCFSSGKAISWNKFIELFETILELQLTEEDKNILQHFLDNEKSFVVTEQAFKFYLECFKPINSSIESIQSLYKKPWFYYYTSKDESLKLLTGQPSGTFLIRVNEDASEDKFYLDFVNSDQVIESKPICMDMPTGVILKEKDYTVSYSSVEFLVNHLKNSLKVPLSFEYIRESWFHGKLSDSDSEDFLSQYPKGTFMVHHPESGRYQLTISYVSDRRKTEHIRIFKTYEGYIVDPNYIDKITINEEIFQYNKHGHLIIKSIPSFLQSQPYLKYSYDKEGVPLLKVLESGQYPKKVVIDGIHNGSGEGISFLMNNIAAKSIATYPSNTLGYKIICDQFYVKAVGNRVIFALADGCNWGEYPRKAAQIACKTVIDIVASDETQFEISDSQDIRRILLQSFSETHQRISETFTGFNSGTTTLIAGVIFQTSESDWGLVLVTVGDCKAFLYSKEEEDYYDITYGNRCNANDARDPGGRLGPYLKGKDPDLRNLRSKFWPLKKEDLLIIVSDGIHDNLDPAARGLEPKDLVETGEIKDLETIETCRNKTWQDLDLSVSNKIKCDTILNRLKEITKDTKKTPEDIIEKLVSHCKDLTSRSREFLENDQNASEPHDRKEYPGKMDHTTGICILIGKQHLIEKTSPTRKLFKPKKTKSQKEHKHLFLANITLKDVDGSTVGVCEQFFSKGYDHLKKYKFDMFDVDNEICEDFIMFGPYPDQSEFALGPSVCGKCITTLPLLDVNDMTHIGDPITSFYSFEMKSSRRWNFSFTSTSTWGYSFSQASSIACRAFMHSLVSKQLKSINAKSLVKSIAQSFDYAHDIIVNEMKDGTGHTGLIGGSLCKLNNGGFILAFINLGINKVYLLSKGDVIDITNKLIGIDRSKSGGKIGFSEMNGVPDISDIKLVVQKVQKGDLIIILSPSVYHNFDPEFLGKLPIDLGIKKKRWEDMSIDELTKIKTSERCHELKSVLKSVKLEPVYVCRKIIEHCKEVTSSSRTYMENNPDVSEPRNFSKFPGRMGHSGCLCFKVDNFGSI